MIDIIYILLILSGLTILGVLYHIKKYSTYFIKIVTEIIKMNEVNEYDPVRFVEHLPKLIYKLGIKDYSYYFYYLDTEYQKTADHSKNTKKKFIYTNDFTLFIEISPGKLKRENAYLANLLVETIFLILKIDINLHLRAANIALVEFSKMNTFLTHDIKNLAQFITMLDHNLATQLSDNRKDKMIAYLKETAPALKMRADRVLQSLDSNAKGLIKQNEDIDIFEMAKNIAAILSIDITFAGENKSIFTDRKAMLAIMENIIKNFYDKSIKEPNITLTISIDDEPDFINVNFSDNGSQISNTEKIFEPFYSEKSGGLGIGLYHCRNLANNINGKLWAENSPEGPVFILRIYSFNR